MANDKAFRIKNGLSATRYLGTNGTETAGTVGYDIAGASYDSKSFSVAGQALAPQGVYFKSDGTKAYVVSSFSSDLVYQYSLSTAWDISTASYDSVSFSVATQDGTPSGVYFKPDGTKMYVSGDANDSVYQYTLSTAWDVSTASYDSISLSVSPQTTALNDVHFKPDGTSVFIVESANDSVYQYTLSTPWNLSTASYASKSFSVATQDGGPSGLYFKDDGLSFYVCGYASDAVYEYTLGTAWDVSTATYSNNSFNVGSQDTNPLALAFKPDGTKLYLMGEASDSIYQYSTVAYTQTLDLSTGHTFSFTPSDATTVSFSNPPASGVATGFTVEVNNSAGGYALTWPSSVKWHLGTAPTATASKEVYTFITTDGGTTYYGKKAGENLA